MGWMTGVQFLAGVGIFLFATASDWLWGPPSHLYNGYWGSFLRGKAVGHGADHSSTFSAEVKNTWSYTSIPIYLHGMVFN